MEGREEGGAWNPARLVVREKVEGFRRGEEDEKQGR